MKAKLTLSELLERAIKKEIEAQRLYGDLARQAKESTAQDALRGLVQQEKQHETVLEKYRRGELKEGALNAGQAIDYKIAEHLDQPEITPDMKLKDVFLVAANREKASHELYLSLAKVHPAGPVKKLLQELAAQEFEHKQKVEFLYTKVAFPQTDGG